MAAFQFSSAIMACSLREATQGAQSSLHGNHAARSIRFAPVLVLLFQAFTSCWGHCSPTVEAYKQQKYGN
ncbi:hypothetical protein J2Y45_006054 [Dyadobacter sp. BE34]|uniref:Secreted protein n=1 Tax=Dyadobacter fermentans TaxID=94254 RepID=A0ABU1R613_9BACT|nr:MULTISPECIES: hypothetical protein [Dyadobacter]MDR7218859.1 hypothetical protein [Dyadobacter sp. BE31]MDR6808842.1 hypothetical protein [Dyadobacter fermentans]MDR7046585.1 hypothetical protein [Dyadobacter sp. BE242]MDR7200898.1 hypothetical protein [Dyadobacter sp. BE34]MDR7266788.1 hypothetical protein [Dyadobacter sp. BE32]